MNPIPWYESRVFIGAVVAILSQLVVLLGKQDVIPVEAISQKVEAVFQIIALAATLYAAVKRKTSDIQPLTLTKRSAEDQSTKQGGFVRPLMLALLVAFSVPMISMVGCSATRQAYQNADTPSDYALVVLEQYDAILQEANRLKAEGKLTGSTLAAVQAADLKAQPFVNSIRPLQKAYEATHSASDAAALQKAVNDAITAVADLIRIVKGGAH